jgi:hypothetical protein
MVEPAGSNRKWKMVWCGVAEKTIWIGAGWILVNKFWCGAVWYLRA